MFRVMDLFAGTQSVKKELTKSFDISSWDLRPDGIWIGYNNFTPVVEYTAFDIKSPEDKNIHFDLSQENIVVKLAVLLGGWKPDFIWASPYCMPFSRATSIKNGTLSFEVIDGVLKVRDDFSYIDHKSYNHLIDNIDFQLKHRQAGFLGLKLFENTKKIINHFKVPFAIENPANAVSRYILKEYIRNTTAYCAYGFDYQKRTAIYSNIKMDLKQCDHRGNHPKVMSGHKSKTGIENAPSSNAERSKVPPKLIEHIMKNSMVQWKYGNWNGKR